MKKKDSRRFPGVVMATVSFFTRFKWQTSGLEHADLHRDCAISRLTHSRCTAQAFPTGRRSLSVMLIDFSSAFNTIVCLRLVIKLRNMGLNSSLCLRILNLLTGRSQIVDMGGQVGSCSWTMHVPHTSCSYHVPQYCKSTMVNTTMCCI